MKFLVLTWLLVLVTIPVASAQSRIFTKTGTISFSAGTDVEDIEGENKSVTSVFDTGTGQIEFAVLMKGFEFKRALMQEHFNENYVESEKFPKAVFKGQVLDIVKVNLSKDGSYPVRITGVLELHGVKKQIEAKATFTVRGGAVAGASDFTITIGDFNIIIPNAVADKISPTVDVHVSCSYKPL
jgi:polyisoprenoid-binding protein YceI